MNEVTITINITKEDVRTTLSRCDISYTDEELKGLMHVINGYNDLFDNIKNAIIDEVIMDNLVLYASVKSGDEK